MTANEHFNSFGMQQQESQFNFSVKIKHNRFFKETEKCYVLITARNGGEFFNLPKSNCKMINESKDSFEFHLTTWIYNKVAPYFDKMEGFVEISLVL